MAWLKVPSVLRTLNSALGALWWRIWFQPKPTTPLELTRMGFGFAMLIHYALATPYLFTF